MSIYIYGKKACEEALKAKTLQKVFVTEVVLNKNYREILERLDVPYEIKTREQLDKMSAYQVHQGIIGIVKDYVYYRLDDLLKNIDKKNDALLLILDGILDPYNLGAIFRSAAAFNVDGVILRDDRQAPITPVVYKVSAGAMSHLKICQVKNINTTLDILKDHGFWSYATSDHAIDSMYDLDYNGKVALIVGNEGKGISNLTLKKADFCVKIPLDGPIPCLNVTSATSIFLAHISHILKSH